MGLTTERKVFLGLAGVAGLALILDQGLLGPKQAAAEMAPITLDSIDDSSESIVPPLSTHRPAAAVLIDRLESNEELSTQGSLGSVFSLTHANDIQVNGTVADPSVPSDPGNGSESSFPMIAPIAADLPVLSSAMPSSHGGGAVLGGKLLMVGQVGPNGYRLVSVNERSVIVERDSRQYTLEIPLILGSD